MKGNPTGRRLLACVAVTLLFASLLWWTSDTTPSPGEEIPLQTPREPVPVVQREIDVPGSSGGDAESRPSRISARDKERIRGKIAEAKDVIHRIELAKALTPVVTETPDFRSTTVHVPALTVDDIQSLYDTLSRAAEEFEARSPAREAFRYQADGLLAMIRKRPSKVVIRSIERERGSITYKVVSFSEGAKLTMLENGGMSVEGKNTVRLGGPDEEAKLADFFDQAPEPSGEEGP